MKLMTLNIWGGHIRRALLAFLDEHQDVDIFCFQEVYHKAPKKISDEDRYVSLNIFDDIQTLLTDHRGYFRATVANVYGLAIFVRKNINVIGEGVTWIYENPNYKGRGPAHSRSLQWIECNINKKLFSIINVHGLWNGRGKTDTPDRIAQSTRIKEFLQSLNTEKILCGDFNLRPDTQSLMMLEENMHNLVKQYKVTSTRTSYYPKEEKFADYILISPDIEINNFKVLEHEVSDHSPLIIDFI